MGEAKAKQKSLAERIEYLEQVLQVLHVKQSCLVRFLELEEEHIEHEGGMITVQYRRAAHVGLAEDQVVPGQPLIVAPGGGN